MGKQTIIPFGPQHPVLPEPLHLDLVLEDERIVDAIPSIGYVHRGLELLVSKKEYAEYVYVAERICGICSFMHGLGYCQAVEEIMEIQVPERALFLRTIWAELSRIHSHLMWFGLAADAFGLENLFMLSWRLRESVLDIIEETSGGRVIFGACKIGGVRRDISPETLRDMCQKLEKLKGHMDRLTGVFLNDRSVGYRLKGIGVLTREDAQRLGAVGPLLRASGVDMDMRRLGYAAYERLSFEPVTENDGDCYARCAVRARELYQSIDLIAQAVSMMPDGEVDTKVLGAPKGECFMRLEQPRGEVLYYVRADGTRYIERFRVRTPTFTNIPSMIHCLKGCDFSDVPNVILTIDPCISCIER